MKIIIGVNSNHADSSACIIVGGKLVAALEEERINRIKHFSGFPVESIKNCIKIAGVKDHEITDIAFNTKPYSNLIPKIVFFLKNIFSKKKTSIKRIKKKLNLDIKIKENFKFNKNLKFHFVEHHIAHLASAFYPSNFKDAIGLSLDGSGDFVSMATSKCKNNKIILDKKIYFPDSLGIFYHAMTQFLGFKNYGDEYKVMGMAAYGRPIYFEKIKNELFKFDKNGNFKLNLFYFNHSKPNFKYIADEEMIIDNIYNENLVTKFLKEREQSKNIDEFRQNFAASVQKVYEFIFEFIIKDILKDEFSKNLIFAGGCGLNSSANRIITNSKKYFNNVYIPFAPGDNGGALGAAFSVLAKYNIKLKNAKSPYLGFEYKKEYLENIKNNPNFKDKIKYKFFDTNDDLYKSASKFISEGKIIGWFQNKMEFGPRALGNRSILADPRNPNMKNIINSKIKRRESFRPFAPSILAEFQDEWFESKFSSPYMSTIGNVKKNKINIVPAITHIDGTARFQTVKIDLNERFYKLINEFYKITNVPIVLNTSFNENEPIVMRPEEAIDCLIRTDMDAVYVNNFLITKIN